MQVQTVQGCDLTMLHHDLLPQSVENQLNYLLGFFFY